MQSVEEPFHVPAVFNHQKDMLPIGTGQLLASVGTVNTRTS